MAVLADHQWSVLEPLLNAARPWAARPIRQFRRTIEAIVWRQQNGAKWRAIPAELGPWWMAAQTFIRWAKLGVWERLHRLVQEHRGLALGMVFLDGTVIRAHQMVFLDGTVIRAHQKAAGARKQDRTPTASAECRPDCHLPATRDRAREQQVRDVDAGDQHHEGDGSADRQQPRSTRPHFQV